MSSLQQRILSALAAVILLIGTGVYFGGPGLRVISCFIVMAAVFELRTILFDRWANLFLITLVLPISWLLEPLVALPTGLHLLMGEFMGLGMLLIMGGVLLARKYPDLHALLRFQSSALLGLFYVGAMPWFAIHLLDLNHGLTWYCSLLAIVFAGDVFAYFFGNFWGDKKILAAVSPKKTVIGSVGGLIGSGLAGLACSFLDLGAPAGIMILGSLAIGAVAQMGDFAESLFKRVADVKDSGSIMPGHGGVLDRLDGVIFASPLIYLLALFYN